SNKSKKSTWTTLSFYRRDMAWFLILDHKLRVHFQRSMNKSLHDAQFNHEHQGSLLKLKLYRFMYKAQQVEEVDMDDPFVLQTRYGVVPHSRSQTARAFSEVDEQKPARRAIQPRAPRFFA
ncbi:hypothetical protein AeMF1_007519, partial [Aphanomyces euteiches]